MKKHLALPFIALMAFVLIVSTACGFSIGKNDDETQEPQVIVVTATKERVAPTEIPTEAPTEVVTELPSTSVEAQPFFLEEFDTGMDNYSWFDMGSGDEDNKMELFYEDSQLKFELNDEYLWPYITYDAYTYTDVRIDVEAENWGVNQNSVTMICRYDEDLGWYEFNIANDGTWYIAYYDAVVAKGYIQLYDGGSTAIKMGRDTNVYTAICQGQDLTLLINGVKTRTVQHKDLREGLVGVGVSSYENYPVNVYFNWLEISEP
jgi:hypothetical protein